MAGVSEKYKLDKFFIILRMSFINYLENALRVIHW
jgi:hypothetical protein